MNLQFIFIWCNFSFKCKYESISRTCSITKITQIVFHSWYVHMYHTLTRTMELSHKMTSTAHFTSRYMHVPSTLPPFGLLVRSKVWKKRKEKHRLIGLSFFPLLCHHFCSGWSTNARKYPEWERMWQSSWCFLSLRMPLAFFLHLKRVLVWKESAASWVCQGPCYAVADTSITILMFEIWAPMAQPIDT